VASAELIGAGWGDWRATWSSPSLLMGGERDWRLVHDGSVQRRWPGFDDAVRDLWPGRARRDGAPWLVGWCGYEELARLAGSLPSRSSEPGLDRGCWLLAPDPGPLSDRSEAPAPNGVPPGLTCSLDGPAYRRGVEAIRSGIARGDVYQVNLTRRFTVRPWTRGLEPLLAAARVGGPPDYLSRLPISGGELVCASMELLLRRRGDHLETRPIKGTRPRGGSPAHDRQLASELDADPKELAELAMIVDLERNDLGRVAVTGTVAVEDPGRVHTYAAVHHRVARVTATAADGLHWLDLLGALAPGGSVTGCPKRAAMHTIAELEPVPRGPFTGVVGVVAGNGDVELALAIRSAWQVGDRLHLAAGCGVVWDSDPDTEEGESRLKVGRWLEVVDAEARW
jgi:anthranilate/para-aminobenzoate synthase component I